MNTTLKALTSKEQLFVDHMMVFSNAAKAARQAGYSETTADKKAPLWVGKSRESCPLNKRHVWDAYNENKAARSERLGLDSDWVLGRLSQEVQADMSDIFVAGTFDVKPVHEWPEIWRTGLVAGYDVMNNGGTLTTRIRFSDRTKRLEMIGKHVRVQAFKEQVSQKHSFAVEVEKMTDKQLDDMLISYGVDLDKVK
jgi:phage terminase small subunit